MVTWSKAVDPHNPEESCYMQVTGLRGSPPQMAETLAWLKQALKVGDMITVEVIDTDEIDTPQQLDPPRMRS